jgi:ATP-dependent Clp protease, protease subunit
MNLKKDIAQAVAKTLVESKDNSLGGFDELFQLDFDRREHKVRHYKQTIPVNIHHFYIVEDIREVEYYLNMINIIRTAEQHDTIFIYLNTPGGNLHTAIQIIAAIRQSSATIVTCLEGVVCSAGTMIFLAGHKHVVNQNCTFMIHNYSQWVGGKGNDITVQVKYTESYFRKLSEDIYGNFLTAEEIESVLEGRDLWMESSEVALRVKDKLIYEDIVSQQHQPSQVSQTNNPQVVLPAPNTAAPPVAPPAAPVEQKPKRVAKRKKQ